MTYILDTTWQQWIKDNIERGCIKNEILQAMVEAGIDAETAQFNLRLYQASQHPKSNHVNTTESFFPAHQPNKRQETSYLFQHENHIQTSDGQIMQVTLRSTTPDIALLDHFMSPSECDELCELSKNTLSKSTVIDDNTGEGISHDARTSLGTYFTLGQNTLVKKIESRISEITGFPAINGEGIQILNYANGGEYRPHFDYFPDNEGGKANMAKGGQRVITMIMYLNDVTTGGATVFPNINLSIYPKKGSALYFSYLNANNMVDPLTLHAGAPVIEGEKWIATKWIRQNAYV